MQENFAITIFSVQEQIGSYPQSLHFADVTENVFQKAASGDSLQNSETHAGLK